jgi:hypothetical protein
VNDLCVLQHRQDPDRPRRAVDGLWLCQPCRDQLAALLAQLPGLYADLEDALASGGASTGPAVSGTASEPLPINTAAADHRHQIQHDLVWWAIYVADERGISRPLNGEPRSTTVWLTVHLDWLAGNRPAAEELLPVLRQLAGRAWAIIDPDRRLPTGERCRVVDDEGERCNGVVTMIQGADEAWTARCSDCGPQQAVDYLRDGVAGRWVTIERVEAYLLRVHKVRVARATIRSWAARELVQTKTEDDRTWYELATVHKYVTERPKRERIGA